MDVGHAAETPPEWFERGVQAALLAPTAMNQQKFRFELLPDGRTVHAQASLVPTPPSTWASRSTTSR